ncbi:MAG: hypothetical protein ACLTRS_02195 [Lachnospiraceae bacterium]
MASLYRVKSDGTLYQGCMVMKIHGGNTYYYGEKWYSRVLEFQPR